MTEYSLSLARSKAGSVLLTGDITFNTVVSVLKADILSSKSHVTIDFNGVNRSDSSGLALMTRWAKQARKANIEIFFENVPVKLVALAKVSGLDTVLTISPKQG